MLRALLCAHIHIVEESMASSSSKKMSSGSRKISSPPPPPPPSRSRQPEFFNDDEYINSKMLKDMTSCNNNNDDDCADEWDDYEDEDSMPNTCNSPGGVALHVHRGSGSSESGINTEAFHFKRSGADAFLFSASEPVPMSEKAVAIVNSSDGLIWKSVDGTFSCSVTEPRKESKFAGMKAFMTYQLTPSFSNIQVSRRYKQFAWLYQRLTEKFTTVSIPPLPEKPQMVGKFEGDFINNRLRLLQLWVLRMCKHPVVSHADVFLHFLTCTDEKKWSKGKRVAEKDEFVRGRWFSTIQAPVFNSEQADAEIEKFSRFVKNMEEGVRQMTSTCDHNIKKHEVFKKEYQKLGASFQLFAKSLELDDRTTSIQLKTALEQTGKTYEEIGSLFGSQPSVDMVSLMEGLHFYRGLLTTLPSSIAIHKESHNKVKEKGEKLSDPERKVVQKRADVITASVLANMLYFQQERVTDLSEYMCHYLQRQIEFHTRITSQLRDALQRYPKV